MKSLFFAIISNSILALILTSCASDVKKTETTKAPEEKVMPADPKPNAVAQKADKSTGASSPSASSMTCTSGSVSRGIDLNTTGAGCELMYTKNGEAKSIATAKNGTTYCEGVKDKLVKNLTAAGFSCK